MLLPRHTVHRLPVPLPLKAKKPSDEKKEIKYIPYYGKEEDENAVILPINQGEKVYFHKYNSSVITPGYNTQCIAGFIDKFAGRIWVAAHCGDDNSSVYDAKSKKKIGTFHHSGEYDVGYVDVDDPSVLGKNIYSSNEVASKKEIMNHKGDVKVCVLSYMKNSVKCGNYLDIVNPNRTDFDVEFKNSDPTVQMGTQEDHYGVQPWVENLLESYTMDSSMTKITTPPPLLSMTGCDIRLSS